MEEESSFQKNQSAGLGKEESLYPVWVATLLAVSLIITIAVDVLGNLLVILSVYKNKKLRKAGNRTSVVPPGNQWRSWPMCRPGTHSAAPPSSPGVIAMTG